MKKTAHSSGIRSVLYELFVKKRGLTLMLLPCLIYVILFYYIPMGGITLAFKDYNYAKGILGSPWIGFKNFQYFFSSGSALRVTVNTFLYNAAFTCLGVFLQVGAAVLLSEVMNKRFKKFAQSALLLPFFISWVVVGGMLYSLLNYETGALNALLTSFGMERMNVMNEPKWWPFIIIAFQAWKQIGYGTVVYLSAITGIDQEIYEAAAIDGASMMQKVRKITLPNLKPTIITIILLYLGNIIKGDFGMFYNLAGNNPLLYNVTDIVDTFVYRSLTQTADIGMSAAAGVYQSVIGFVIIMSVNAVVKRVQPDYALF